MVVELAPGEKLKIDGLRRRLETGASPIREALSLLTSDNLVERLDQRGFRTAEVSAENFHEILVLRCTLEDLALRDKIATDVVLARWAERCGADCADNWNKTVGPILGLTASSE